MHADDLEWTEMYVGRASEIRNIYVRTKGRFAYIGAAVLGYCISTSFRAFIIRSAVSTDADAKITLINVWNSVENKEKYTYFNLDTETSWNILWEFP